MDHSSQSILGTAQQCKKIKEDANEQDGISPADDRLDRIMEAKETKRKRKDTQATKMKLRRAKFAKDTGAEVGAVVRIGNDRRDIQNPRSAIGVIFDVKDEAGGILVCTEWGVLVSGQKRSHYWVPCDRYEVIANAKDEDAGLTVSPTLDRIRLEILSGEFDPHKQKQ